MLQASYLGTPTPTVGLTEGQYKAAWKMEFTLPWRKAGLLKSSKTRALQALDARADAQPLALPHLRAPPPSARLGTTTLGRARRGTITPPRLWECTGGRRSEWGREFPAWIEWGGGAPALFPRGGAGVHPAAPRSARSRGGSGGGVVAAGRANRRPASTAPPALQTHFKVVSIQNFDLMKFTTHHDRY